MKYLFGLSKNCNGFPTIIPKAKGKACAFGIGSYSQENPEALVFKKVYTHDLPEKKEKGLLSNKDEGSATFIACFDDQADELQVLQPFSYNYAARDWVCACEMSLAKSFQTILQLDSSSYFTPEGATPEEHVYCWLMQQIIKENASSLENLTWARLHEMFESIASLGPFNILISDGHALVAYHHKHEDKPFYVLHSNPPHKRKKFDLEKIMITLDHRELNHNLIMFSNTLPKVARHNFKKMSPGQMLVISQSECLWDSTHPLTAPKETSHYTSKKPAARAITAKNELLLQHITTLPLVPGSKHKIIPYYACDVSKGNDFSPTIYSIVHQTHYEYDEPVNLSKHLFRLQPVHDFSQSIMDYKLLSSVNGHCCNYTGAFGNASTRFTITEPYTDLILTSQSLVIVNKPPLDLEELMKQQWSLPLSWMPWDQTMLQTYLMPPELPESELFELCEYAMGFVKRNNNCLLSILDDINTTIYREYKYLWGATDLSTTPFEVYVNRKGVCQDFANLFICLARLLNVPARYRVGYIFTGGEYENQEQGDATHAWVEIYMPRIGWMGFDPTNGCHESKNHVRVAVGRYFSDATPTSGTIYSGGGREKMSINVQMRRLAPEELHL